MSIRSFLQLGGEKRIVFDRRCLKTLRQKAPLAKLELVDDGHIRAVDEVGEEHNIYTENAWRNWHAETSDFDGRETAFQYWIATITATLVRDFHGPVVTRDLIVPQIKDNVYVEQFGNSRGVKEHLTGDLWIVYCVDTEQTVWSLSEEEFLKLELPFGQLRSVATENLLRILPEIERHGDGSTYFMLSAGTVYCASLLLLDDIWDEQRNDVNGDIVAVAPCRDVLLFTGSNDNSALAAMRKTTDKLMEESGYLISNTFVRRRENKWVAFS